MCRWSSSLGVSIRSSPLSCLTRSRMDDIKVKYASVSLGVSSGSSGAGGRLGGSLSSSSSSPKSTSYLWSVSSASCLNLGCLTRISAIFLRLVAILVLYSFLNSSETSLELDAMRLL